ncbi:hypothetical protein T02_13875 [Trichinella nativa]|uniref:Uncharacterized protein n=1 Tax=Trichinella nativa TaxID=6335 RepID=A0A0V1L3W7_9BILA|nr:hypothetical protein T02_13875 [Trichinella nativa]
MVIVNNKERMLYIQRIPLNTSNISSVCPCISICMIFLQKQGPYCHHDSVQDTAQEYQPFTRSGPGMLNNWPNKLASFDVGQRPGLMLLRDTSMRWMLQEMDGRNAEFFTITTEIAIEKMHNDF